MKLVHAEFTNFRLLRDLILEFSTDPERKLTVIRAENESGKTTIMTALQWALYGDAELPGGGRQRYRLHPIDWDRSEGDRVTIAVEVDFEIHETRRSRDGGTFQTTQTYRLIRSTHDTVQDDGWNPGPTTVQLFELTDKGIIEINPPEARIRKELPNELREVFFTDGDRTLSFIEGDVSASTKQTKVQNAIESLLGLRIIKDTQDHLKKTASEINKQARSEASQIDLQQTMDRITVLEDEVERLDGEIEDADSQFIHCDQEYADYRREIDDALRKGDQEQLRSRIAQINQQIDLVDKRQEEVKKKHSDLFKDITLSRDLIQETLAKAFAKLDELRHQGKIPNNTIPVLEERLSSPVCICGESLQGEGEGESKRRSHIQHLIEESREADQLQSLVTDLYFGSGLLKLNNSGPSSTWDSKVQEVFQERDDLDRRRQQLGAESRATEVILDSLGNTDLQGLRDTAKYLQDQRDQFNAKRSRERAELDHVKKVLENQIRARDQVLRRQVQGLQIIANLEVTSDIEAVLRNTYHRLTNEELMKVSMKMGEIFLEMIGADPQQRSIIRGATISQQFEITVYGAEDRPLNPDRDLNGASRRALALAFILALTKVSEIQAPNVIDTPLGMMSTFVKESVLRTTIRESSQLVLFLTRSEINGCEEVLDKEAGQVITLTNPAHFPIMLENDPQAKERNILTCGCNHREECSLCKRKLSTEARSFTAV